MTRRERLPRLQNEMAQLILRGGVLYRPEDGEYLDAGGEPIGGTRGRALRAMSAADMLGAGERVGDSLAYTVTLTEATAGRVRMPGGDSANGDGE